MNVRSIIRALNLQSSSIRNMLDHHDLPDIIAFTETWLQGDSFTLRGYDIAAQSDRDDKNKAGENRVGGGLLVLVKTSLKLKYKTKCAYKDNIIGLNFGFECEKCEETKNFDFYLVYRRPGPYSDQETTDFTNSDKLFLEQLTDAARNAVAPSVFVGDFNFQIKIDPITGTFSLPEKQSIAYNHFSTNCYLQHVNFPTHNRGNILDLIFSRPFNFVSNVKDLGYAESPISTTESDHCMITFDLNPCN
jgi:hypothetical protein